MRPLPTISQVMSMVRQETDVPQVTKQAAAPSPQYASEIARGLHEVADILKAASDMPVTYDDVLNFGRTLLGGGK